MDVSDILVETFGRLPSIVRRAVEGLDSRQLAARPAQDANSIGWLVWHLTRIQDDHVGDLLDQEQLWTTGDWARRFGLSADPANTGYGHDPAEMAAVQPESADALIAYFDAVADRTIRYLAGLSAVDLDRVVDDSWDPPVTVGARLVSVASDDLQHAGQANYMRGLLAAMPTLRS